MRTVLHSPQSVNYFDTNIERWEIFRQVFCKEQMDLALLEKLYKYCKVDEHFSDLADFVDSGWKAKFQNETLEWDIQEFMEGIKESKFFLSEELSEIKRCINKEIMHPGETLQSQVQERIGNIMKITPNNRH
jgi:hypothetical protein